jgi:hypothetical protein
MPFCQFCNGFWRDVASSCSHSSGQGTRSVLNLEANMFIGILGSQMGVEFGK